MKRITQTELQKKRVIAWGVFAVFIVLAAIVMFADWLFPPRPYEELLLKDVVVEKLEYQHVKPWWCRGRRASREFCLYTQAGEMYVLSGYVDHRFETDENYVVHHYIGPVQDKLIPGAVAQIKYFESSHRWADGYAEEVTVDWQQIVTYDDDVPPTTGLRIFTFCLSLGLAAIGALVLKFSLFMIEDRAKKEQMRNRRIEKKYGKKTS